MRVVSVDASDSVYNAADIMIKNSVGCVVVTEYGDLAGIVTKGDILRNSLLKLLDPKKTTVQHVMTKSPVTIEVFSVPGRRGQAHDREERVKASCSG